MKYLIITLSLFVSTVYADEFDSLYKAYPYMAPPGHPYNPVPDTRHYHTVPNVFYGEDFYQGSDYLGQSHRNVHGGRDFYPQWDYSD